MKLFEPIVDEGRQHQHFKTVLAPEHAASRQVVEAWADGFPNRDGKFVQEFQLSFNSPFWEIYLYAVFREYGFDFDWSHASPDFALTYQGQSVCVEAVTANAADGKPNEWDFRFTPEKPIELDLEALNREAMVRLANAIYGKHRKYQNSYSKLGHVAGKPFVLAVAPFEQPRFNHQYNRPIKAVLYDHYVDEPAYQKNPAAYPNGPPNRNLGFVTKDNGADIELGVFNDDRMRHISAVLFSCTATYGKVDALAPPSEGRRTIVQTIWGSEPDGRPVMRAGYAEETGETLTDGLQIYHNPYAQNPLDPAVFRRRGVVQNYLDEQAGRWVEEELTRSLYFRFAVTVVGRDDTTDATGPNVAESTANKSPPPLADQEPAID